MSDKAFSTSNPPPTTLAFTEVTVNRLWDYGEDLLNRFPILAIELRTLVTKTPFLRGSYKTLESVLARLPSAPQLADSLAQASPPPQDLQEATAVALFAMLLAHFDDLQFRPADKSRKTFSTLAVRLPPDA